MEKSTTNHNIQNHKRSPQNLDRFQLGYQLEPNTRF